MQQIPLGNQLALSYLPKPIQLMFALELENTIPLGGGGEGDDGAHISFPLANRRAHHVSSCTGDPHKSPGKLSMIVPISQMRKPRFRVLKGLAQGPTKK